jgi:hypothetical protein
MSSANSNELSINTLDQNGLEAKTKFPIASSIFDPSDTVPQAIKTAMKNACNSFVTGAELSTQLAVASYTPPTGTFTTVQDVLYMTFTGDSGTVQTFKLPLPLDGIYITDSDRIVDLTNTDVATAAGAYLTNATDQQGNALAAATGMLRVSTKLRKGK